MKTCPWPLLLFCLLVLPTGLARAQALARPAERPLADNVIMPQLRAWSTVPIAPTGGIELTGVEVDVEIEGQLATTRLDVKLRNRSARAMQAELVVPVPEGAVVRGFGFKGAAAEMSAELLPREQAREIYNEIVRRAQDPALLEFLECRLVRSSVFPVEAGGTQQVRLIYEQLLPLDGSRIDYLLPRSESLDIQVPWQVKLRIRAKEPIATIYSPTHTLPAFPSGEREALIELNEAAMRAPGPLRVSWLLSHDGIAASLFAYPDPKIGGGYFLLLAGPPEATGPPRAALRREVTLVLDHSGSMGGRKIEQAREAALQILAGLEPGESFNIISYNETLDWFSRAPVVKDAASERRAREWISKIQAHGGTNIHDALVEALRQPPTPGTLPVVLFLTDGMPTVGQTAEPVIGEAAEKANTHKRRIYSFGVGLDVNVPLLERIAQGARGRTTFVLPDENIEVKVGQVYESLSGPLLTDPELVLIGRDGKLDPDRTRDHLPARLPDLFKGDQLIVLGQYRGEDPLRFRLSGDLLGESRELNFTFNLEAATTSNAFVPRLWASRKIAVLVDAIRQAGAQGGATVNDAAIKELVDEVVRLSTEWGILTEYTSFLAREGTDLSSMQAVQAEAAPSIQDRALKQRSGIGAVSQGTNNMALRDQATLNYSNEMFNERLESVQFDRIRQLADRTLVRRDGQWVDTRLINDSSQTPARRVDFGSAEYEALAGRLAGENRAGLLANRGEILLQVGEDAVLFRNPE